MKAFALIAAVFVSGVAAAAGATHARFGADAFNRAVSAATRGNAAFSPYSFEIGCVALSDAFDPIVKAHFAETLGVLSEFGSVYVPMMARVKDAATSLFEVVTARALCIADARAVNVPYRRELQNTFSMEVCPGVPPVGAEAWLRSAMGGAMEDFTIPLGTVSRDVYALYDLASVRFSWKDPFPVGNTRRMAFHRVDGSRTDVEAMCDLRNVDLWRNRRFSMIRLPLADQGWFYALLPAEGLSIGDIREEFSSQKIDDLLSVMKSVAISGVSHGPVAVVVPKMDFTTDLDLKGVCAYFKFPLKGFERMDRSIRPGAVRQRVRMRLDEQGLDPAPLAEKPADAIVHGDADTPRFVLNRPFLFFVYHEPTGTIPVAGQFTGM